MISTAVVPTAVFAALVVAALSGQMPALGRRDRTRDNRLQGLSELVRRAGSSYKPGQVVAASVGAGLIVGAIIMSLTPVAALAIVPAGVSSAAPVVWLRRQARNRVAALRRAWPDALAQVSGNIRAGRPLSHALIDLSLNGPPPLLEPLAGLAARIQTVGLVTALHAVRDSVAEPVTDRIIEVMVLAHTEGGRMVVNVIDDLTTGVAEEVAASEETETLALEGKLNARLVFALPWLVLVMLTSNGGPFQAFYTSVAGVVVIMVGVVISALGMGLVTRLSTTPPQPRVLINFRDSP